MSSQISIQEYIRRQNRLNRSLKPLPSKSLEPITSPTGFTFQLKGDFGGEGGVSCPFQISPVDNDTVKVVGSLQNLVIFGTESLIVDTDEEIEITEEDGTIFLKLWYDDYTIPSAPFWDYEFVFIAGGSESLSHSASGSNLCEWFYAIAFIQYDESGSVSASQPNYAIVSLVCSAIVFDEIYLKQDIVDRIYFDYDTNQVKVSYKIGFVMTSCVDESESDSVLFNIGNCDFSAS